MKELLRGESTISLEAAVLKCPNAELYLFTFSPAQATSKGNCKFHSQYLYFPSKGCNYEYLPINLAWLQWQYYLFCACDSIHPYTPKNGQNLNEKHKSSIHINPPTGFGYKWPY
jgi:hypothetical protein